LATLLLLRVASNCTARRGSDVSCSAESCRWKSAFLSSPLRPTTPCRANLMLQPTSCRCSCRCFHAAIHPHPSLLRERSGCRPMPEASRQAAHPLWCRVGAHHCCLKLQHLQLLLTLLRDQLRKPGSVVVSRVSACVFVPLAHMMPTPDSLPQHCRPALVGSGRRARASFLLLSRCSNSSSSQLQAGYSLSADSPGTFCYILCSVYLLDSDATCQWAGWTGCRVNMHERDDRRVPRELHTFLKRQELHVPTPAVPSES
jgi:hypothetical protein